MHTFKNQKGFGALEVMLVLIIIILVGVVGWMVYKNHHKTTASTNTTTAAATTPKTNSAPPSQSANISTTDASQYVTNFYAAYKACGGDGTCENNLVEQDGTAKLHSYYKPATGSYGEDPIMCAQSLPDSIGDVSDVTTTPTTASGAIANVYGGTPGNKIKFTIMKVSGSLKLDTITCDPALHPSTVGA